MSLPAAGGVPPETSPALPPAADPPPPPQALNTRAVDATSATSPAPRRDGLIVFLSSVFPGLGGVSGSHHGADPRPVAGGFVVERAVGTVGAVGARSGGQRRLARRLDVDAALLLVGAEGGEQLAVGAE